MEDVSDTVSVFAVSQLLFFVCFFSNQCFLIRSSIATTKHCFIQEDKPTTRLDCLLEEVRFPFYNTKQCVVCGESRKLSQLKAANVVDAFENHCVVVTTSNKACRKHFDKRHMFRKGIYIPIDQEKEMENQKELWICNMIQGISSYTNSMIELEKEEMLDIQSSDNWDVYTMGDDRMYKLTFFTVSSMHVF